MSLEALAEHIGIELEFVDALGKTQRASRKTQKMLLAAMGVDVETDAEAAKSLEALQRREWERTLPPCLVVYAEERTIAVDLTFPADTTVVAWLVELEGGGEAAGKSDFDALPVVDEQWLDGCLLQRRRLDLGQSVPPGYHRLILQDGAETVLIVTPGRCWLPPALTNGQRIWGLTAQLYLLRSAGNWGIGDYGDLRRLVEIVDEQGGDVIGLNPLHAMFLDDPEHASPYSPASRLLLNTLNINVASLPELAKSEEARRLIASPEFQQRLGECQTTSSVDYATVADLKIQVLRLLFTSVRAEQSSERGQSFERFRRDRGEVLERSCLFLALRQHFAALGLADWRSWPEEYRDPASLAVAQFARDHETAVTFQVWLQWLADGQLAAAAEAAERMAVGLYRDLAVGAAPSGAETWANQRAVVTAAQVGCPPDVYNTAGQDWGLPPFNPVALREEAYRSFIDLVRTNMRHAGGLRIDHVMALRHVYWVPKGLTPDLGAYLQSPIDDLVGILALESQRNRCLVVGEDLGTVPEGFRERMAAANILSYRVLTFEKDDDGFIRPDQYPTLSLAVAGNHDLPTLQGWWQARDLALKETLKLFPSADAAAAAKAEREVERGQMTVAMRAAGLLPVGAGLDVESLIQNAHSFLARSTSMIAMAQIDDLTGEADPVNVPTTSDEHPNWRRKLSLSLDELADHPRFAATAAAFATRNTSPTPGEWHDAVALAEAELPPYLLRQRWYSGKDAGLPVVALEQLLPLAVPGILACIALWTATTQTGVTRRLFLPLAVVPPAEFEAEDPAVIGELPSGERLVDALRVDAFVQHLVRVMLDETASSQIEAGHTARARQAMPADYTTWSIRRSKVEQSNTSIRIGEGAILKAIRTLETGVHPELEMGRFLTEDAPFEAMPALLGWMNVRGATLAVLQSFVANEGDGWSWILDRLQGSADDRERALVWIGKLGERTAEMHRALASETDVDAFKAEEVGAEDILRWKSDIAAMLGRALDGITASRSELDAEATKLATSIEDRRDDMTRHITWLLSGRMAGLKTRHHGDYHLGQVLVQGGDAIIVDFEGEPLRALAERRAKHSPLRDVAGMLRSIDYAAAVAERDRPDDGEAVRTWAAAASAAYREHYLRTAGLKGGPDEALRLIVFFTLEKALYEIVYELANRPGWVAIPLGAVAEALDHLELEARTEASLTRSVNQN